MMDINFLQGNGIEALPQFLTSLAIGLLIGLERERNPTAKAGLRTFALTALFGVLAAHLGTALDAVWLIPVGLLLVGAMMIAAYLRDPAEDGDPGTTTVAALMLCYGLGVLVWHEQIQLAVMLGIAATLLLYFKPELRGISQHLTRRDLLSVLQFAVLALIILPLLPNRDYGPYGAINPYQIWWMVVLIAGVGLAGYAALRIVGQQRGAVMLGLLGGLVSSTATDAGVQPHARASSGMPVAVIVIVLANLVVLVRRRAGDVLAPVLSQLLPVLIGGLIVGGLGAAYGVWRLQPQGELPALAMGNPTELRTALGFGLMYAVVLLAAAWLSDWLGTRGLYAVALVSGLTDVVPSPCRACACTIWTGCRWRFWSTSSHWQCSPTWPSIVSHPGHWRLADGTPRHGGHGRNRAGAGHRVGYNARLFRLVPSPIMEAESLNQIESKLADLGERATQLRGFL
jgi:uncharacterized membrane protein (DUF4010 family)